MQLFEDRVGCGRPFEGLAVRVVGGDEVVDSLHELLDAGKRAAADRLVGDHGEEALDLIEPGAVGRDEMHVPARLRCQPGFDLGVIVGRVVVGNAVDAELGGHSPFDFLQKRQIFLVPVARLAGSQHRPVEHIQCGEQRGRAVTLVVVGDALDVAQAHGQHRLGSLQGLALALLVHAEDQGVVGRAQVQADHVAQFLDEERVIGQLEASGVSAPQVGQFSVGANTARRSERRCESARFRAGPTSWAAGRWNGVMRTIVAWQDVRSARRVAPAGRVRPAAMLSPRSRQPHLARPQASPAIAAPDRGRCRTVPAPGLACGPPSAPGFAGAGRKRERAEK